MAESFFITLGDPLPLSLTLPDGSSSAFPQAFLYDSIDVAVSGSPFDLAEVASTGRYTDATFVPTGTETFTALFIVYTDSGHLTESSKYDRDQDSFAVKNISSSVWDATRSDHTVVGSFGESVLVDSTVNSASFDSLIDGVWDEPVREHLTTSSTGDTLLSGTAVLQAGAIAAAVWDRLTSSHTTAGTMGEQQNNIEIIRALMENNWELSGSQMVFYADDGVTPFRIFNLFDTEGDEFFSEPEAPAERVLTSSLQ